MEKIIKLNTNRSEYDILEAAKSSITVRQFVDELLNNYDEDAKIVFSNDNGYTYGYVTECGIEEELVESREERERREKNTARCQLLNIVKKGRTCLRLTEFPKKNITTFSAIGKNKFSS